MIKKKPFARVIPTRSVLYSTGYPERHFPAGMQPQKGSKRSINYAK
jgi:hypothetical protein